MVGLICESAPDEIMQDVMEQLRRTAGIHAQRKSEKG
jgi:hypothetical protein